MNKTYLLILHLIICLIPILSVSGCGYATASINNIGLRERVGDRASIIRVDDSLTIPIDEYKMTVSLCVVAQSDRGEKIKHLGSYKVNLKDISWVNNNVGHVTINIQEEQNTFQITSKGDEIIYFTSRYKKWYWYPTQTLRIVTYPVDATIGIFWFGAAGIASLLQ